MNIIMITIKCILTRALMQWRKRHILALMEKRDSLAKEIVKSCVAKNQDEINWKVAEANLMVLKIERSQALKIQTNKQRRPTRCAIRVISG